MVITITHEVQDSRTDWDGRDKGEAGDGKDTLPQL